MFANHGKFIVKYRIDVAIDLKVGKRGLDKDCESYGRVGEFMGGSLIGDEI